MTIFLCVLTVIACCDFKVKATAPWAVALIYFLHVILVLGLAVLAVWTWRQP